MSGPPLMRGLDFHKNSPVSVTKLTLCLRAGFFSSHLTVNKLFPVNPRAITGPPKMSLLLEAKNMPALISKPRLILVTHMDDLGWNTTSNQQGQMFVKTSTLFLASKTSHHGRFCIAPQTVFQFTLSLRKTFLLTHKFGM